MHDVPNALAQIGAEVADTSIVEPAANHDDLIKEFISLSALLEGEEVIFEFKSKTFKSLQEDDCEALSLRVGGTVSSYCRLDSNDYVHVYAENELAKAALKIQKNSSVKAKDITRFGKVYSFEWIEDGSIRNVRVVRGIKLTEIIGVSPPEKPSGLM